MPSSAAQNAWIARVLGYEVSPQSSDIGGHLADTYRELRAGVVTDLAKFAQRDRAAAAPLATKLATADRLAAQAQFEGAIGWANEVAEALAGAAAASRSTEAASAVPKGTVAGLRELFERAASRWDQALAAARGHAQAFQRELADTHPEEAKGLATILESYWHDLSEPLRTASGDDQDTRQAVLARIAELRGEIEADSLFSYLDRQGVALSATYRAALDEVQTIVAA